MALGHDLPSHGWADADHLDSRLNVPTSVAWWLLLSGSAAAYLVLALARVAFRLAGPVTLGALVERIGTERTEFLRKSLRAPTAFWFSLSLANGLALLAFVVVLLAGHVHVGTRSWAFGVFPTGVFTHDALLFLLLAGIVAIVEFVVPVAIARLDKTVLIARMLPVIRVVHRLFLPLSRRLEAWSGAETEPEGDDAAADEEVEAFISVGQREGIIEESEGELLRNIVLFGETRAHEVMTPRTDVVGIGRTATIKQLLELMSARRYSRVPVHDGGLDAILGIASLKDAVAASHEGREDEHVTAIMTAPFIVPEGKLVNELLREMQARRQQLAVVADEYGGTAGIVTIEDLLEELVGEIREEHEDGEDVVAAPDGTWLARGRAPLHDVGEAVGANLETDGGPATLAGLLLARCDRVPAPGEIVRHDGLVFTVEEADRRRVRLVRIARAGDAETGADLTSGAAS